MVLKYSKFKLIFSNILVHTDSSYTKNYHKNITTTGIASAICSIKKRIASAWKKPISTSNFLLPFYYQIYLAVPIFWKTKYILQSPKIQASGWHTESSYQSIHQSSNQVDWHKSYEQKLFRNGLFRRISTAISSVFC